MRNPNTIDSRELIPVNYALMGAAELKQLKANLWHSITKQQTGVVAMHREYNAVSIALKDLEVLEAQNAAAPVEGQGAHG